NILIQQNIQRIIKVFCLMKNLYFSIPKTRILPKKTAQKTTPLMKQYNAIKAKYPDALLLFRVGDFYETFGEDAVRTARILNIVLTNRNNGGERTELAGF